MKLFTLFMGMILTWGMALASLFEENASVIAPIFCLVAFGVTVWYVVEKIKNIDLNSNK